MSRKCRAIASTLCTSALESNVPGQIHVSLREKKEKTGSALAESATKFGLHESLSRVMLATSGDSGTIELGFVQRAWRLASSLPDIIMQISRILV
jgi:hypothetical protein